MGRVALLVFALLPSLDDFDSSRKALLDAVIAANDKGMQANLARIAELNEARSSDALQEAYLRAVDQLKTLEKEAQKHKKEMDEKQVKYDEYGRYIGGNAMDFMKAEEAYNAARHKIGILEVWLPRFPAAFEKLTSEAAIKGVIEKFRSASDWYVRAHAAHALGKSDSKDALAALLDIGKKEKDSAVRGAIADALAKKTGSTDARAVLESFLTDECWQVRLSAGRALAAGGDKNSLPALIETLKTAGGRMRNETNAILIKMTGVDKHGDYTAWKEWFEKNKAEILDGTYKPKSYEQADNPLAGSTIYGVPVTSSRILFMIDISQSMFEPAEWKPEDKSAGPLNGDTRMAVAQYELKRLVKQLPEGTEFNLMIFDRGQTLVFEKPQKATKSNKDKAGKFVDAIKIGDGTWTYAALLRAYDMAGGSQFNARPRADSYDTIFLISDGVASAGPGWNDGLVDRFVEMNRFRKIAINAIAVEAPPEGRLLMQALAEKSGGLYVSR